MSRSNFRESLVGGGGGGRTLLAASHHLHRRGHSLNSLAKDPTDENLDLFSRNRRSLSLAPSDDPSDAPSVKLGRLSLGSAKVVPKTGIDDLLSSIEGGKNDYDWLLTPPGTPLFPSTDANESSQPPPPVVAPRNSGVLSRSNSTAKASRLSVSQSESYHSARPARSSSVTRSSTTASHFSTYTSNRSPSSILNTSSASVSSYTRPSSPLTRSPSIGRPSTPSGRSSTSRPSTPSRGRQSQPSVSLPERSRPSPTSSRPSTPTSSRSQISASFNSSTPAARSSSRPSTPTRRTPVPSISPVSTSGGRPGSSGRASAPSSRPSSPSPRVRAPPQQPVVPPDFPLDTPPNLRTTLPERPLSAGRSRPGAAIGGRGAQESSASNGNVPRRTPSPIVTRGRVSEPPGRGGRISSNGHAADVLESRKSVSDSGARRPLKSSSSSSTSADSTGFGRNISKKSLDMAIRHMDIRNGAGVSRPVTGTTLFPQSIRGGPIKTQTQNQTVRSSSALEAAALVNGNGHHHHLYNGEAVENGNYAVGRHGEMGSHHQPNEGRQFGRLSEGDVYESSRYDAMLLKEDVKNMNWLHSIDDKFDQASIFDHGFEPLPEPFAPL